MFYCIKKTAPNVFLYRKSKFNRCRYLVYFDQSVLQARAEGYKFEAVAVEMSATKELNAGARDNS